MIEDFPFIFRARIKELLEITQMTIQDLTNRSGLPRSVVNRILYTDSLLIEKEYINAIINGFDLTYEEFFLPRKSKKQARDALENSPQRIINLVGDDDNFCYLDLAAYFKTCGYTSTISIAKIVDHWYDFISDEWILEYHPKRKNPIYVPIDYKNPKSFIGGIGERPKRYLDWLSQY